MEELVKQVAERTGISEAQAQTAVITDQITVDAAMIRTRLYRSASQAIGMPTVT